MTGDEKLFDAIWSNKLQKVEKMLNERNFLLFRRPPKANVQAVTKNGTPALNYAADRCASASIIELLISKGADVNIVNKKDKSPLDYGLKNSHPSWKGIFELLIPKVDNMNVALRLAVAGGFKEIVEVLIAKGADMNAALHLAVDNGLNEMAWLLIAKGADVNAVGKKGITPLHRTDPLRNC